MGLFIFCLSQITMVFILIFFYY